MYRDAVVAQFERLTLGMNTLRDDVNRILEEMRRDREERARGRDDAKDRRQEVRNIGEPRVENLEGEVHIEEEFEEAIEEEFDVRNYNYGGRGYRPPRARGARGRRGVAFSSNKTDSKSGSSNERLANSRTPTSSILPN
ncbi:hypothetical protein GH714_041642 [Hevea brasiliensis]|uniref:Uncharacterized protein n=1 Tax=Hevea brasiliensis TaxID=3981 RepID=A0A6A6MR86_HEVBR|nr:hypothetical protein GH714_041642 [Hevea brasiliensis]